MISKNKIKQLQQFHQKKQRDAHSVFFIEGAKLVEEALQSDFIIREIYATESWIKKNSHIQSLITQAADEELKKISLLKTVPEVWALVEQKKNNFSTPSNRLDSCVRQHSRPWQYGFNP